MTTTWREFEQLVARIEESLAPTGAKVKSPDRVKDLVSGRLREVDASIRYNVGSTHILITIECRKRRGVQDDTWIEQLATKRAKIGAAKTIAVSATGFTESAVKTAQLHGIELRTLKDRIGEEIVQQFVSGMKLSLIITCLFVPLFVCAGACTGERALVETPVPCPAILGITVTPAGATLAIGKSIQFTARVTTYRGSPCKAVDLDGPFARSVTDSSVARVHPASGQVVAHSAGEAIVIVRWLDDASLRAGSQLRVTR